MNSALLESPIWTSLTSDHKQFAVGTGKARRFNPDVGSLGAMMDDSEESLADMGDLVVQHGTIVTGQSTPPACPPGTRLTDVLDFWQMRANGLLSLTIPDHPLERLGAADAAEMLSLAELTKPGPFALQTHKLGEYWGIRYEGRLVAMAGERLKQGNFVEVSGVCTHPDFVGRGMAVALCWKLTSRILNRGAIAYLHVAQANESATQVYKKLGFQVHLHMFVTAIEPAT